MSFLQQKNILIGITGGIAAYKTIELIRRLSEAKAHVRVVVTKEALAFVTPLTLQTVSGHKVFSDLLDPESESAMSHIDLARWADVILITPATANIMAKIAHGIADDLLTTLCLATTAKIIITPAMNQQMWLNEATQRNFHLLMEQGITAWGPDEGSQACGEFGPGRMLEPLNIINLLSGLFAPKIIQDCHVVITAGPTIEPIDPVRFISNHSSGKMGYALAKAAQELGAKVTLISGPSVLSPPANVHLIKVDTTNAMYQAVMSTMAQCHIFISAAAVADYRVDQISLHKIKKGKEQLQLSLQRNPDILASVTQLPTPPFTVGFAAETENLLHNAKKKLFDKNLNMIVANPVGLSQSGFNSDSNQVTVITREEHIEFPLQSKKQLAQKLMQLIAECYRNSGVKS